MIRKVSYKAPLSSGEVVDENGYGCIKCSFIRNSNLENIERSNSLFDFKDKDQDERNFYNYIGTYTALWDGRRILRKDHTKLANLLDKYEKRLLAEYPSVEYREELKKDFVAELEELGLVEFKKEKVECLTH